MPRPIFGCLDIRREKTEVCNETLIECKSKPSPSNKVLPTLQSPESLISGFADVQANIFLPPTNVSLHSVVSECRPVHPSDRDDLLRTQRELMDAHRDILALEAELRQSRK